MAVGTIFLNTGTGAGGVGTSTVSLGVAFDLLAGQTGTAMSYQLYNPESPCTPQVLNLVSGANTINTTACPALATASGVFILPPVGQGATITLKGVAGDTGIAVAFTGPPIFLPFTATPPSSFVITTSSTLTGLVLLWV